jgi:hypothetical protein
MGKKQTDIFLKLWYINLFKTQGTRLLVSLKETLNQRS